MHACCCWLAACCAARLIPTPCFSCGSLALSACRGFITLSASLGQMLVALHRALLHSIQVTAALEGGEGLLTAVDICATGMPPICTPLKTCPQRT